MQEEQGAPAPAPEQGGGGLEQIVAQVDGGLAELINGVPEEAREEGMALQQAFQAYIQKLTGGGAPQEPQPESQGMVSPEQGGNPNAQPMR